MIRRVHPLVLAYAALGLLAACKTGRKITFKDVSSPPPVEAPAFIPAPAPKDPLADIPRYPTREKGTPWKRTVEIDALLPVYFGYDEYTLGEAALSNLKANVEYLRANPRLRVVIEGHCDTRGTGEYNLALGMKRAQIVEEYYGRALGYAGRLKAVSYGEERPPCNTETEGCWTLSRRAVTAGVIQ